MDHIINNENYAEIMKKIYESPTLEVIATQIEELLQGSTLDLKERDAEGEVMGRQNDELLNSVFEF